MSRRKKMSASRRARKILLQRAFGSWALAAALLLAGIPARGEVQAKAFTDHTSYNVGSTVQVNLVFLNSDSLPRAVDLTATVRYTGESKAQVDRFPLSSAFAVLKRQLGYRPLWKIPQDARTGRYEIEIIGRDPKLRKTVFRLPGAASFVVRRQVVAILRVELDRTFYTAGDPIGARVTLKNLSTRTLAGLRVEFSDRYWPWIGPVGGSTDFHIVTLSPRLVLPAGGEETISSRAAIAETVKQPSVHQYAVVVWDRARQSVYAIGFSPLAFIRPPGADSPRPYPGQYAHAELSDVNVSNYRQFYPLEFDLAAIQFDHAHTMFDAGADASVKLSFRNPTARLWRQVSARLRFLSPDGRELSSQALVEAVDLDAGGPPVKQEVRFVLPAASSGVYRAVAELSDPSGEILAANTLELGVNRLPKSLLVFCGHEDDEMGHGAMIRAAVENHVPVHVVYFTSGDAGSCDRYFQHSCGPAEALNFGALRMEEARAALGHLGVPREDIYFFGLPDGGSGEIWYNHPQPSNPYLAVLLSTDHTPYDGLARPNLPYARESVVEAVEELIKRFEPEMIYTAHPPDDRHVDHIVCNYFVVKALQYLRRQGEIPPGLELIVDQIHNPKTHPATPYHYQENVFYVSGEGSALVREAAWFYQSQGGMGSEGNLRTFGQLPRTESYRQVLDWEEHEGWNERR